MKAVRYHEHGDASALQIDEVDVPRPGAGEVLVEVAATAFNGVDAGIRGGFLRQVFPVSLPHVPGIDVAGTVVEVGASVTGLRRDDAVIGFLPMGADGASADYVVAPSSVLAAAPTSVALVDAAALPSVGLTAWQALFEHIDLQAGQRLLVNGAGGAVGGLAVALARQAGAVVIATVSPRSAEVVRAHGAEQIIDHTTTRIVDAIGEPLDAVLNLAPMAPSDGRDLIGLVRPGGVIVTTVPPPLDGSDHGVRTHFMEARSDAVQLAGLVAKLDAGDLHLDIGARRPLTELAQVHAQSDAGALRGKVVLLPSWGA